MRSLKLPKKFLPKLFSVFFTLYVAATLPSLISAISTFVHIIQAAFLEQDGKLDEANTALRKAIKPHFLNGLVSYALGNTLNKQGKRDEAITAYRQATQLYPDNAQPYNALGEALHSEGKLNEAIAAYRQAIKIYPNYAAAYNNLGSALHYQGKLNEAIAAYRQAIKIDPKYAAAYNNLGSALHYQGKLNDAIAAYRQAIQLDPKTTGTYYNLGNALSNQGQLDQAIATYRQAIQLNPKDSFTYVNLGNALRDQGKLDDAIAAYRKAIQFGPNDPAASAYGNLGYVLRKQNKPDQAIAAYRKAIAVEPDKSDIASYYCELGDAWSEQGKREGAIIAYRKSIQLAPKLAFCYTHLSNALQQQGKLEEAIKALKQAIALEPNNNTAKFYFKEAQRLLAFRQKPQLRVMPERLPSPKAEPLVSLKRSIVQIIIKSPSNWETGTGWVVKREGSKAWIVTNRHVVAEGNNTPPKNQKIEVEFYSEPPPSQFRKRQPARIAKITPANSKLDLALLEVTGIPKDIKPLPLSPKAVSLHAPIRTIGHPNTIGDWTIAKGKVSNKTDQQLQLSTTTALGSSGSPVLDSRDRVVGVVWGGRYIPQRAVFDSTVAFPMQPVKEQLLRWGIR
jgi:superkiller protein 3